MQENKLRLYSLYKEGIARENGWKIKINFYNKFHKYLTYNTHYFTKIQLDALTYGDYKTLDVPVKHLIDTSNNIDIIRQLNDRGISVSHFKAEWEKRYEDIGLKAMHLLYP